MTRFLNVTSEARISTQIRGQFEEWLISKGIIVKLSTSVFGRISAAVIRNCQSFHLAIMKSKLKNTIKYETYVELMRIIVKLRL